MSWPSSHGGSQDEAISKAAERERPALWAWSDTSSGARPAQQGGSLVARDLRTGEAQSGIESSVPAAPRAVTPRDLTSEDLTVSSGTCSATAGGPFAGLTSMSTPLTPTRSRPTSGRVTPILNRSMQAGHSPSLASQKTDTSSGHLVTVRRELEAVENRLHEKIARMRENTASTLEKTDRIREAACNRLDQKLIAHEGLQAKLDRKIHEFAGELKALSEEAQIQIRRADAGDMKIREVKRALEDDFRQKWQKLETQQQEMLSKCRVINQCCEDSQKRLKLDIKRLEVAYQDGLVKNAEMGLNFAGVQERLEAIETVQNQEFEDMEEAKKLLDPSVHTDFMNETRLWHRDVEEQLKMARLKLDQVAIEAHGEGGFNARLQEHEVRITKMREKLEAQDEHYASFDDRVRQDWEARFIELHKCVKANRSINLENTEKLETLEKRTEGMDQAIEDVRSDQRKSMYSIMQVYEPAVADPMQHFGLEDHPDRKLVAAHMSGRIERLREDADDALNGRRAPWNQPADNMLDDELLQADHKEIASGDGVDVRIDGLVAQLKEVVPKIIEHDASIRQLLASHASAGVGGAAELGHMIDDLKNRVFSIESRELQQQRGLPAPQSHVEQLSEQQAILRAEFMELKEAFQGCHDSISELREADSQMRRDGNKGKESYDEERNFEALARRVSVMEGMLKCMKERLDGFGTSTQPWPQRSGFFPGGSDAGSGTQMSMVMDQDGCQETLTGLVQRVDETESECSNIQQQLKKRIATMDKLLEKVESEVLGPVHVDEEGVIHNQAALPLAHQLLPPMQEEGEDACAEWSA